MTAYNDFIKTKLAQLAAEYPSNTHNDNMKMANAAWTALTEAEKLAIYTPIN